MQIIRLENVLKNGWNKCKLWWKWAGRIIIESYMACCHACYSKLWWWSTHFRSQFSCLIPWLCFICSHASSHIIISHLSFHAVFFLFWKDFFIFIFTNSSFPYRWFFDEIEMKKWNEHNTNNDDKRDETRWWGERATVCVLLYLENFIN